MERVKITGSLKDRKKRNGRLTGVNGNGSRFNEVFENILYLIENGTTAAVAAEWSGINANHLERVRRNGLKYEEDMDSGTENEAHRKDYLWMKKLRIAEAKQIGTMEMAVQKGEDIDGNVYKKDERWLLFNVLSRRRKATWGRDTDISTPEQYSPDEAFL